MASQSFEVDWLVGSEEKAEILRRGVSHGGPRSTGVIETSAHRIRTISADPAAVIPDADLILMVVPAFAHADVLRRIAPHVTASSTLGCMPTRGGFEFLAATHMDTRATVFGLQTLPWSTRVTTFGETVHIGAVKQQVFLASLPAGAATDIARAMASLLGTRVLPTDSFLGLTLGNPGQIIHPGLMYGHFRSWQGGEYDERDVPLLYAEATDEMGAFVQRLSDDVAAVARRIEATSGNAFDLPAVVPIHQWLKSAYGSVTTDTSSVAACFRTGPIQARRAPMLRARSGRLIPNFRYRYLTEDVPYGLCVTRAIAELVEVATPAIDEVITWAQARLDKRYLVDDAMRGHDVADLPLPRSCGVTGLAALCDFYREYGAAVPVARSR